MELHHPAAGSKAVVIFEQSLSHQFVIRQGALGDWLYDRLAPLYFDARNQRIEEEYYWRMVEIQRQNSWKQFLREIESRTWGGAPGGGK